MIDGAAGPAAADDTPPPRPDAFERALLDALAGLHSGSTDALRAQAAAASVVRRDRAPDGVTTYFCVAADAPRLADGERSLRARVTVDGAPLAAAASAPAELLVHNGWLDSVTVLAPADAWPAAPRLVAVERDEAR